MQRRSRQLKLKCYTKTGKLFSKFQIIIELPKTKKSLINKNILRAKNFIPKRYFQCIYRSIVVFAHQKFKNIVDVLQSKCFEDRQNRVIENPKILSTEKSMINVAIVKIWQRIEALVLTTYYLWNLDIFCSQYFVSGRAVMFFMGPCKPVLSKHIYGLEFENVRA